MRVRRLVQLTARFRSSDTANGPVPVNPGTHKIEATAPGHVAFSQEVDVQGEHVVVNVSIPVLDVPGKKPPNTNPIVNPMHIIG